MCIEQWPVFEYVISSESQKRVMAHYHTWMAVPLNPLRHKGHSKKRFTVLINKQENV